MKFEVGQKYGNDLTIEVLKRTAKMLVIKSSFGEQRIKFEKQGDEEIIYFKSWVIGSTEIYNEEEARELSMYKSYYL